MRNKKKTKMVDQNPVKKQQSDKITFDIFFSKMVKEERLFFWQRNEILTFFTENGLSTIEDQDKYEEILKLFY